MQSVRFSVALANQLGSLDLDERRVRFAMECICKDEFREAEELLTAVGMNSSMSERARALLMLTVTEQALEPIFKGKNIIMLAENFGTFPLSHQRCQGLY
jgi:hypothetical protein